MKFAGDAMLCIWPPPPETIFNEFDSEYKRLEKKWRRYQDWTDSDKQKDAEFLKINAEFEAVKKRFSLQKAENQKTQKEHAQKNINAAIQCAVDIQNQCGRMDLSGAYHGNKGKKKEKVL